jgi:DNA-binding CsgD family transcriptional regulator
LTTTPESGPAINLDMIFPGIFLLAVISIIALVFLFIRQNKLRQKAEMEVAIQQNQVLASQKALNQLEIETIQMENSMLSTNLELKRKEMNTLLMNLSEQRYFYDSIVKELSIMKGMCENKELARKIKELKLVIKQKMSFSGELGEYYAELESVHKDFILNLTTKYPDITTAEKRLATLVRLDFSNKEISAILNISPKSVEIARYRLRKKLNVRSGYNLTKFLTDL